MNVSRIIRKNTFGSWLTAICSDFLFHFGGFDNFLISSHLVISFHQVRIVKIWHLTVTWPLRNYPWISILSHFVVSFGNWRTVFVQIEHSNCFAHPWFLFCSSDNKIFNNFYASLTSVNQNSTSRLLSRITSKILAEPMWSSISSWYFILYL